jgi:tRNA nucleotidyltransferase (CCA-adding enzyme)
MPALPAPNLIDKLERRLPRAQRRALAALSRAADARRLTLYLVGGSVRDLLLDRPTLDIDITLEGDAPALARRVAGRLKGVRCVTHAAFGTATLRADGYAIDLATTRSETYSRPGALPTVRPGTLVDDLYRRDFTVNTMALPLNGPDRGSLVDPFGGRADLEARRLRALHEASFRDDATRILRGARYEARLGLRFQGTTLGWIRRDARYLRFISGPRLRQELLRTFGEPQPGHVLRRLGGLGALAAIDPALSFDAARATAFRRLRDLGGEGAPACFALLAWGLTPRRAGRLAARLALTRREAEAVRAVPAARALAGRLARAKRPSRAVEMLSPLPLPAVWALAAAGPTPARRLALRYLEGWRRLRTSLDGDDLIAMGAPRGPVIGSMLARLRAAKLDGEAPSRRDEERLARRLLARHTPK